MQANLEYKWEDVKVGDIITVELPYTHYLLGNQTRLTGEVVNIVRIEQTNLQDPLMDAYRFNVGEYLARIKTNEKYKFPFDMEHRYKEYVIQSHIWNLVNIERKNNMEEQEQKLKVGDTVLVISNDVKRSLGFPKDQELTAEIAVYRSNGQILIHSKQLEELRLGHNGEHPQQFPNGGCWWVRAEDLQLTEKAPEFDIFM